MADAEIHRWELRVHGVHHRVEITGSFSRTISWFADDRLVAQKKSSDDKVQLSPTTSDADAPSTPDAAPSPEEPTALPPAAATALAIVDANRDRGGLGAIGVRFTALGRARRVTWYGGEGDVSATAQALIGTGGIDLDPEPGSPAARREERIRLHPRRHAATAVALGVAKVVVPIVLGLLAVRLTVSIPWPDWNFPSIPWPDVDLPSIPRPDIGLPSIPWPDIAWPDITLPEWVRWLLDKVKFIWPVLLAWGLARAEINRRRKQDALKAQLRADALATTADERAAAPDVPPATSRPVGEEPGTDPDDPSTRARPVGEEPGSDPDDPPTRAG